MSQIVAPTPDHAKRHPRQPAPPSDKDGAEPGRSPEHEGATEEEVGDRTGPAAGYDKEPVQVAPEPAEPDTDWPGDPETEPPDPNDPQRSGT